MLEFSLLAPLLRHFKEGFVLTLLLKLEERWAREEKEETGQQTDEMDMHVCLYMCATDAAVLEVQTGVKIERGGKKERNQLALEEYKQTGRLYHYGRS